MVAGFTPANGLVRLDGIGVDPAAVMRGGDMLVDPQTGEITNIPWSDGSGDKLVITPRVLDCGVAASPVETAAGFEIVYKDANGTPTGVRMQTHNFATERKLPVLADVAFPASKSLLWLPPGMIHDSGGGYFRPPKEYEVSGIGINSGTWHHQPDESGNPDVIQPWWAINSWARYHDSKANNCPGKNYMTGKEAHLIAPSLVLWNQGRILKISRGIIEWIDPVTFRKAFPMAEIAPFLAGADQVSVDATLGYTSAGASASLSRTIGARKDYSSPTTAYDATENGVVDSVSMYGGEFDGDDGAVRYFAIYNHADDSLITNSQTPDFDPAYVGPAWPTGATWNTANYITKPSIVSGTSYVFVGFSKTAATVNYVVGHDSVSGYRYGNLSTEYDTVPNPLPTLSYSSIKARSIFITYTPSGNPWYYYLHQ